MTAHKAGTWHTSSCAILLRLVLLLVVSIPFYFHFHPPDSLLPFKASEAISTSWPFRIHWVRTCWRTESTFPLSLPFKCSTPSDTMDKRPIECLSSIPTFEHFLATFSRCLNRSLPSPHPLGRNHAAGQNWAVQSVVNHVFAVARKALHITAQ